MLSASAGSPLGRKQNVIPVTPPPNTPGARVVAPSESRIAVRSSITLVWGAVPGGKLTEAPPALASTPSSSASVWPPCGVLTASGSLIGQYPQQSTISVPLPADGVVTSY